MFEKAIRTKLRFNFSKGTLSVEDLWDLSLTELNDIYQPLQSQFEQADKGSLLGDKPKNMETVKYKIDILKYVATTKKEEAEKAKKAVEKKQQKAKLLELMEKKQNSDLETKTPAELMAMLNALESE